jgi:hypothetical protein
MSEKLDNIIAEFGDSFSIKDISILVPGLVYYFTCKNKNIYKGKFEKYINEFEERFIFENVEIYDGTKFKHFTQSYSATTIDKIYYL